MATLSAARHNPAIKPFYDRLRAAGKPVKVARCAAARKLLHLAWALVTKQQRFDPTRQQQITAQARPCVRQLKNPPGRSPKIPPVLFAVAPVGRPSASSAPPGAAGSP